MSSHHFVKEHQEPALIIANGESCERPLLDQLLEWSPQVIVLDGALERVAALNIKIDVLLGDFDRITDHSALLQNQPDVEIVHAPDQNKTDLEKALDYLITKGQKAVNIIWATGLRMDHTFNNICTLAKYHQHINMVMHDHYSRIFVLPKTFQKFYTKGQALSLFAMGEVAGISTSGLAFNLNNESLHLVERSGSSNAAAADGIVHISYEKGILILMECND